MSRGVYCGACGALLASRDTACEICAIAAPMSEAEALAKVKVAAENGDLMYGPDERLAKYPRERKRFLAALSAAMGIKACFISDQSCIADFGPDEEDLLTLSEALGTKVERSELIVDVLERMSGFRKPVGDFDGTAEGMQAAYIANAPKEYEFIIVSIEGLEPQRFQSSTEALDYLTRHGLTPTSHKVKMRREMMPL